MGSYSVIRLTKTNQDAFWDKLETLKTYIEDSNALYAKYESFYMEQRLIDLGYEIEDLSFIACFEDTPYAAFLGCKITKEKISKIQFFEIPGIFIEISSFSKKMKKNYLDLIDKIILHNCCEFHFTDLNNSPNSYAFDYLIEYKNFEISRKLTRKIDLNYSEELIRAGIRKSYHSLINWGLREMEIKIFDSSNIQIKQIDQFRKLHLEAAGRETRSYKTWLADFESIKNTPSFIIFGYLNKQLITAGFFCCDKKHCYYGVSASKRDLFDKPLFHSIMWMAIKRSKKIGIKMFETGFIDKPANMLSDKEKQIAYFKKGFGGRLYIVNEIKFSNLKN